MFRSFLYSFAVSFFLTLGVIYSTTEVIEPTEAQQPENPLFTWWQVQSVDTMKYSRDLAREMITNPSFDKTIDEQLSNIESLGVTHVAIATPYDNEFIPMLTRWVNAAHKKGLKVWFRGNFSGWEQWFDYPPISRDEHLAATKNFIAQNPALFEDGDMFTPCPECENGGPGDPRSTGDVQGYQAFLVSEYNASHDAFSTIGKNVSVGYFSMNYDVATLVMDPQTTRSVGGIVTIDHYTKDVTTLIKDIQTLEQKSKGKIFIGEVGAPIPDIHGAMSEEEQYTWLRDAFTALAQDSNVLGVSYWVNVGGTTGLWSTEGKAKRAVEALREAYIPVIAHGTLYDQFSHPLVGAHVASGHKTVSTDQSGQFFIPYIPSETDLSVRLNDTTLTTIKIAELYKSPTIRVKRQRLTIRERIWTFFLNISKHFRYR